MLPRTGQEHYFRLAMRRNDDILYRVGLKVLAGVGPSRAKKLVAYCGGVREFFETPKKALATVPGIGTATLNTLDRDGALRQAEKELEFVEKEGIRVLFYLDPGYPNRLRHCEDGPVVLYAKGNKDLNPLKVVSIVGTRSMTEYGRELTDKLVEGLKPHGCLIVSGLALGVDVCAHRAALRHGLPTAGVLGHSLDRIYPSQNRAIFRRMAEEGMLLSEFESGTKPDRENFPQRNRIVAGMADVTVVVETAVRGGSMITASLAAGYNRDVMAYPGPVHAIYSSGCNYLIKSNQAALIESVEDLEYIMGWERGEKPDKATQKQLFVELSEQERLIYDLLQLRQRETLDNLSLGSGLPVSKTSTLLLEMEFKGVVKALPGKVYGVV